MGEEKMQTSPLGSVRRGLDCQHFFRQLFQYFRTHDSASFSSSLYFPATFFIVSETGKHISTHYLFVVK